MFYPRYPLWKKIMDCKLKRLNFPPQHQDRHPAFEFPMIPLPIREDPFYKASGKLQGKVCIVLGGDSGIGASVAILYAKEGADLVIVYYDEHIDARATQDRIREIGQECLLIAGDLREKKFCNYVIAKTIQTFGKIDVLVLNQAIQIPQDSIEDISEEQLRATFETNVYPHFFITQAALPFLKEDARIIVTASVTAYGKKDLIDYSATKGSLVTFTRSLAKQLAPRRILVNSVAPGATFSPLTMSYSPEKVAEFGSETLWKEAAQPYMLAPTYVFLASRDSCFITGQCIHVNGGTETAS